MNFDSKCERLVVQVLGAFKTEHKQSFCEIYDIPPSVGGQLFCFWIWLSKFYFSLISPTNPNFFLKVVVFQVC